MSKSSMLKEGMKGALQFPYQQEHPHEDEVPRHQERDVLA